MSLKLCQKLFMNQCYSIINNINKFGESYKVITEQECNYIPKDMIKKLIEEGIVVLVKNSEKVFEKYKH